MKIYQAVFCGDTLGFFASHKKAESVIIEAARHYWKDTWTEEAIDEWVEHFLIDFYNDWDDTFIIEDEVDMDMSMEDR